MNITLEYYFLLTWTTLYYVISFDAWNNRNRSCSHYVISREGVMQCNVIACLCFSLFLTLSDPGYFVPLACRRWYKKAHPYYFNN